MAIKVNKFEIRLFWYRDFCFTQTEHGTGFAQKVEGVAHIQVGRDR